MSIDNSGQRERTGRNALRFNDIRRTPNLCSTRRESRIQATLTAKPIHINLRLEHLLRELMTLRFSQKDAVLVDKPFAAEDKVLRALAKAATAIDIAANASGTLLGEQVLQISIFAHQIVIGTEVEDDISTLQGKLRAWRDRRPKVFANLYAKRARRRREEHVCADRYLLSADKHRSFRHIGSALEPSFLVELPVVGQECLRYKTENLASLHDCRTVEQCSTIRNRQADDTDDIQAASSVHQVDERHLCLIEQELLSEEVAARISSQREFRQANDFYALALGLNDKRLNLLNVVLRVGNLHRRYGRSYFYKSVIHICDVLFSVQRYELFNNKERRMKNYFTSEANDTSINRL